MSQRETGCVSVAACIYIPHRDVCLYVGSGAGGGSEFRATRRPFHLRKPPSLRRGGEAASAALGGEGGGQRAGGEGLGGLAEAGNELV